ncbi:MAG TPA: SET domain-containing protein, partial [Nitrososphaeraceae archaeon]|nr:SET domain-containing protein [Nitrososphaeraceae archaeon]
MATSFEIKNTSNKGKGLFLKNPVRANECVINLTGKLSLKPHVNASLNSIQIDDDTYIDVDEQQDWQYINHSCSPNMKLDLDIMGFVAIRDIDLGEEITFHYCTTEFDLLSKNEDFCCRCGSTSCLEIIKGFSHLTQNQKQDLKPILISYLQRKLKLGSNKIEIYPGKPKY